VAPKPSVIVLNTFFPIAVFKKAWQRVDFGPKKAAKAVPTFHFKTLDYRAIGVRCQPICYYFTRAIPGQASPIIGWAHLPGNRMATRLVGDQENNEWVEGDTLSVWLGKPVGTGAFCRAWTRCEFCRCLCAAQKTRTGWWGRRRRLFSSTGGKKVPLRYRGRGVAERIFLGAFDFGDHYIFPYAPISARGAVEKAKKNRAGRVRSSVLSIPNLDSADQHVTKLA